MGRQYLLKVGNVGYFITLIGFIIGGEENKN